jgi:hypothetical protein
MRQAHWRWCLHASLAYVCAYQGEELIGFVNLAWDGGINEFLLDTTAHPRLCRMRSNRRRSIDPLFIMEQHARDGLVC